MGRGRTTRRTNREWCQHSWTAKLLLFYYEWKMKSKAGKTSFNPLTNINGYKLHTLYADICTHWTVQKPWAFDGQQFNFSSWKTLSLSINQSSSIGKDFMKHCQSWIDLLKVQFSTSLKHCGIVLAEDRTKGSRRSKKSFGKPFKKPGDVFQKTQENLPGS